MECRPKIVEPQNREDWEEWRRNICYSFQSLPVFSFIYPGFQVTGDDWMGAFNKTPKNPWTKNEVPKNPMLNFPDLKIYRKQNKFGCTLMAELHGQDMKAPPQIFRLFRIPKNFLLKSSHPKNTSQIFLPNKILQSKIWNP